jgi:AraC family transcriptional regulator
MTSYHFLFERLWPIALADAAKIASMERTGFSAFFAKRTGITFSRWLRGERLKLAARLLAERRRTITDAAMLSGFAEITTFNKSFKLAFGVTPSEWRTMATLAARDRTFGREVGA